MPIYKLVRPPPALFPLVIMLSAAVVPGASELALILVPRVTSPDRWRRVLRLL